MNTKLTLSTGKEIELTEEENQELKEYYRCCGHHFGECAIAITTNNRNIRPSPGLEMTKENNV